jgi:single stranded DNA-binding protein
MIGVNKVIIIGHLGADPEIHRAPSTGAPIASFSLATSERWTDKATGEKRDRTEWHRVVVYQEGLAKIAEQYHPVGPLAGLVLAFDVDLGAFFQWLSDGVAVPV